MLNNPVNSPRHYSAAAAFDEFSIDSTDRRPLLIIEPVSFFAQIVGPYHNTMSNEYLFEIWHVGYPVGICNRSFNSETLLVKSGMSKFQSFSEVSGVLDGHPIGFSGEGTSGANEEGQCRLSHIAQEWTQAWDGRELARAHCTPGSQGGSYAPDKGQCEAAPDKTHMCRDAVAHDRKCMQYVINDE